MREPSSAISLRLVALLATCSTSYALDDPAAPKAVTMDFLLHIEFFINHPAEKVWPYILNTRQWTNAFPVEIISGMEGQEGEICKVSVVRDGKLVGEYFSETVRILPYRQVVVKYLPLEKPAGLMESIQGYDVYDLETINGRTRVIFQTFQQYGTTQMSEEHFREYGNRLAADAELKWREEFIPKLKMLLQEASPSVEGKPAPRHKHE